MKTILSSVLFISLVAPSLAEPLTFDFKDPKGVNNVVFKTDAPLEAINGSANDVSGTLIFGPANPAATRGKIVVGAKSLHVSNPVMKEHLHGEKWLNTSKNPEINFEIKEVKNVKQSGEVTNADVTGIFSLNGVSKELTIPAKATYLKDKLSARSPNLKGDLLVVRSSFTVKRTDFNINPGQGEDKVSNEIELTLSIAGYAKK